MAYPPAPRTAVLPSFISTLADPLTTMTCSVGVCQCHGIAQPALPLKTITDGPLDGSPLSTAAVTHWGNPGRGSNLFSAIVRSTPMSSARAINTQAIAAITNLMMFLLRGILPEQEAARRAPHAEG